MLNLKRKSFSGGKYDLRCSRTWSEYGFLANLSCLGENSYPCQMGSLDFAGGGPVHITAGFSGLAYLVVLGKRKIVHAEHHNLVNVMFGTGVLWFGWFAFNGASAGGSTIRAAMAATVSVFDLFIDRLWDTVLSPYVECHFSPAPVKTDRAVRIQQTNQVKIDLSSINQSINQPKGLQWKTTLDWLI